MNEKFLEALPEQIKVDSSLLKKKPGRKTTEQRRRMSQPVQGKVRGKRNHFTDKEKLNAVCTFAVSGNSRRVAELTGIPEGTIRSWKQTEWWHEAMSRIISEQDEELGSELTKLVNKAVANINERLDEGDWVYNAKNDKLVRVPVKAKDMAVVTAIAIDKRQLLRGQPTSRTETVSKDQRLEKLADQFAAFVKAKEIVQEPEEEIQEAELIEEEYDEEDFEYEDEEEQLTINELFDGEPSDAEISELLPPEG